MIPYPLEDPAETEAMLLEYTSNNMFGDFDQSLDLLSDLLNYVHL